MSEGNSTEREVSKPNKSCPIDSPQFIATDDKLQLKTLEADIFKARLDVKAKMEAEQAAVSNLEQFATGLFSRLGVSNADWVIDLAKLTFVKK